MSQEPLEPQMQKEKKRRYLSKSSNAADGDPDHMLCVEANLYRCSIRSSITDPKVNSLICSIEASEEVFCEKLMFGKPKRLKILNHLPPSEVVCLLHKWPLCSRQNWNLLFT